MRNARVIELGLGTESSGRAPLATLRGLVEQSVAVLRDALVVYAEADYNDCCDGLEECRAAAAEGAEVDALEARLSPCLDAGRKVVSDIRVKQQERRLELTSLIALIREAVSAVGVESTSLRSGLSQSLDRFEAVGQFGDIHEIKRQITAEVKAMKRIMAERHAASEARLEGLGERIALLEHELLTSRHEAALDPLTQVANRRTFDRACGELTRSPGSRFVLAVVDVDGFKLINDAHGHGVGDQALVTVAHAIKAVVRAEDLVARLGGDEFAVLASGLSLRQADARLKAVVAAVAASRVPSEGGPLFTLTVSCGAAEFSAGDTTASVVQRADEALYEAKRAGKNRVVTKARPFLSDLMKRR